MQGVDSQLLKQQKTISSPHQLCLLSLLHLNQLLLPLVELVHAVLAVVCQQRVEPIKGKVGI